jgi:molybdenum cofactor biosynthesis MoaF-like protein
MDSDPIRGSTIRWSYSDGPTKGTEFEHVFAKDGTVTYRALNKESKSENGQARTEKPSYEVANVGPDVWAVSYLAPSGFTLTTILDLDNGKLVSFASNEKQLFVQHGTFEIRTPTKV